MSVILRPELSAELLPLITLVGGLACASAVEEHSHLAVALKWPNDLYLSGRKLGGILAQTAPYSPAVHGIPFVVLGIGINVNTRQETFPPELRSIVTSLYDATLGQYDLDSLMGAIHTHLSALLPVLRADVAAVVQEWRRRDYLLGREITWQDLRGRTMTGRGAGIRGDGCYQLQGADGSLHAIVAGDVTISSVGEPPK